METNKKLETILGEINARTSPPIRTPKTRAGHTMAR